MRVLGYLFVAALAFGQEDSSALLREADSQFQNRLFQQASDTYRRALTLQPPPYEALPGFAKSQIALGRPQNALPALREALQIRPDDRNARRILAEALSALRQFAEAESILEQLTSTDPRDRESWFDLGSLMYDYGYYNRALIVLEKSAGDDRADPSRQIKTEIYRAICLSHLGRTKEAEAAFEALSKRPEARGDPDLLLVYAELLYETGRPEAALVQVNEALAGNQQQVMGYVWQARILLHLRRLPEAAAAAERAVALVPQLPFARALLVRIYRAQGRSAEAASEAEWLRQYEDRQPAPNGGNR